ncbi:hypothetical protein BDN71DRAFT_1431882 [Pleurotus eryngii]|uniref:Uncharacterized protein n=1 Tax=Pleurotus eryngii TaxID=5323 RepID=A0A9P5ZW52_PLEER|nr:hypothetical protein BDN71DRAFT_1431882 [Pleurotus eryngii]
MGFNCFFMVVQSSSSNSRHAGILGVANFEDFFVGIFVIAVAVDRRQMTFMAHRLLGQNFPLANELDIFFLIVRRQTIYARVIAAVPFPKDGDSTKDGISGGWTTSETSLSNTIWVSKAKLIEDINQHPLYGLAKQVQQVVEPVIQDNPEERFKVIMWCMPFV